MEAINQNKLIRAIRGLPKEALPELANFVDFLQFKMNLPKTVEKRKPSEFLLSIADLGTSEENDISERNEEILNREINSLSGWTIKKQ